MHPVGRRPAFLSLAAEAHYGQNLIPAGLLVFNEYGALYSCSWHLTQLCSLSVSSHKTGQYCYPVCFHSAEGFLFHDTSIANSFDIRRYTLFKTCFCCKRKIILLCVALHQPSDFSLAKKI